MSGIRLSHTCHRCAWRWGDIEFDPYSDAIANQTVKANQFRSKEDDQGAAWPDVKTVFMNPPYSRGSVDRAVTELTVEWRKQKFSAIVLVNNATETKWFQLLLLYANGICLTHHRIAFYSVDGKAVSGNPRGQTFSISGTNLINFIPRSAGLGLPSGCRGVQHDYRPYLPERLSSD